VILAIADALAGRALVVVDEAYIEFAGRESLAREVAAAAAACRAAHAVQGPRPRRRTLRALIADPEVIALLRKVIAPYAVSAAGDRGALLRLLEPAALLAVGERIALLRAERSRMLAALAQLPRVTRVWPSDANFLLAQFSDATAALERAREGAAAGTRCARLSGVLPQSLRITVGTAAQNEQLLEAWAVSAATLFIDRDGTLIEEPTERPLESLARVRYHARGVRRAGGSLAPWLPPSSWSPTRTDSAARHSNSSSRPSAPRGRLRGGAGVSGAGCKPYLREHEVEPQTSAVIGDRDTDLQPPRARSLCGAPWRRTLQGRITFRLAAELQVGVAIANDRARLRLDLVLAQGTVAPAPDTPAPPRSRPPGS